MCNLLFWCSLLYDDNVTHGKMCKSLVLDIHHRAPTSIALHSQHFPSWMACYSTAGSLKLISPLSIFLLYQNKAKKKQTSTPPEAGDHMSEVGTTDIRHFWLYKKRLTNTMF